MKWNEWITDPDMLDQHIMGLEEHFASYVWTLISRTLDSELPRYEPVLVCLSSPTQQSAFLPPPSSIAPLLPGSPEDTPNTTMAPERTTGRGLQTEKIACIKFSPYPKPDIGEALELHFYQGPSRCGDKRGGLDENAGCETRHYQALSSAWELREAEHYSNFMKYIYQANHKKYGEYLGDGQGDVDLDHVAEIDDVENFLAFSCEAYNKDIMTFQTMNTQLNQLEEEVQCHVHDSSSKFDGSSDCNAGDRYAELGVNDSKDGLMGPVDST
ncbi:hypothetical protein BKA82DRAFT_4015981 [Pisolithus tinctorius]|nr:hypothetical protein BKA82DRAFT_4015981 [Pisolithus tinctorius]